jgi:hypothetical protein
VQPYLIFCRLMGKDIYYEIIKTLFFNFAIFFRGIF